MKRALTIYPGMLIISMFLFICCPDICWSTQEVSTKSGSESFSWDKFMEKGTKGFSKKSGLKKGQSGGFKVVESSTDTIEEKGEFNGKAYEKKTVTTETKESTFSTDTVKEGSIKIKKITTCYYDKDGRLIGKEEKRLIGKGENLTPMLVKEYTYEYDSEGKIAKETSNITLGNSFKISKTRVIDSETGEVTEHSTIIKTSDGGEIEKKVECERILDANGNVLSVNWTAQYSDGRKMTMVKEGGEDYTIKYYDSQGKECSKEEWYKYGKATFKNPIEKSVSALKERLGEEKWQKIENNNYNYKGNYNYNYKNNYNYIKR